MVMTVYKQQDSKFVTPVTSRLDKSNPNLGIRIVCVEDSVANTGFRKISAYIKSIHQNTKIAYVPTFCKGSWANKILRRTKINFGDNFGYFFITLFSYFLSGASLAMPCDLNILAKLKIFLSLVQIIPPSMVDI